MKKETALRALAEMRRQADEADREIVAAEQIKGQWLELRDRRRRQIATVLRWLVSVDGSQRRVAAATGMSQSVISRTLNPEGHMQDRETGRVRDARNRNLASSFDTPQNVEAYFEAHKNEPGWSTYFMDEISPEPTGYSAPSFNEALKKLQKTGAKAVLEADGETNVVPIPQRKRRRGWEPRNPRRPELDKWFEQFLGWSEWAKRDAIIMIMHFSRRLPNAAYEPASESEGAVGKRKEHAAGTD